MYEVLLCIATWRITYMLYAESAPFGVLDKVRDKFGGAFDCFYCLSIWVGYFFAIFTNNFLIYGLIFSTAAIFLQLLKSRLE